MSRPNDLLGSEATRSWRERLGVYGPIAAVVIAGFVIAWQFVEPPPPKSLALSAGAPGSAYTRHAEEYRQILAESGIELEILESPGSLENLERLAEGECDLALVQGGMAHLSPTEDLQSLGSLYFEPLWVFLRTGFEAEYLSELEGARIGVGPDGSGSQALALELLDENGVDGRNATIEPLPVEAARRRLLDGQLDAALFVTAAETEWIAELIESPGIELMSMRRHLSYRTRRRFLSSVTLGEGMLDLDRNIPAEDKILLAPAAVLVATAELHPALTPVLLDAMTRVHRSGGFFEEPGQFPSTRFVEFPMSDQARAYLENGPSFLHRYLPFQWASLLDRLKILLVPLLTLLIPLIRVAPPIYQWRIRSKVYRWYKALRAIDLAIETNPNSDLAAEEERIQALEREVHEIQVPLSYMDEVYHLRAHVHLVRSRLERIAAEREAKA